MVVDPGRAAVEPVGDGFGAVGVGAPDGAAEAEAGAVRGGDGLVESAVRQDGQDRPELFAGHHRAAGRDIGEDGGGEEVAGGVQPVPAGRRAGAVREGAAGHLLDAGELGALLTGPSRVAGSRPGPTATLLARSARASTTSACSRSGT